MTTTDTAPRRLSAALPRRDGGHLKVLPQPLLRMVRNTSGLNPLLRSVATSSATSSTYLSTVGWRQRPYALHSPRPWDLSVRAPVMRDPTKPSAIRETYEDHTHAERRRRSRPGANAGVPASWSDQRWPLLGHRVPHGVHGSARRGCLLESNRGLPRGSSATTAYWSSMAKAAHPPACQSPSRSFEHSTQQASEQRASSCSVKTGAH